MEIEENEGGGTSVLLFPGDRLDKVPSSHQKLITSRVRQVFADPVGHFNRLADECPFSQMATWLRALLAEKSWYLALHRGALEEMKSVGFGWSSEKVRGAEISPSIEAATADRPEALRRYYALVDRVQWMPFCCSGGLDGASSEISLAAFSFPYHGAKVDPDEAFVFGSSPCGDMIIYTLDGRGGWACHENGKIHLLGTIEDTINWVFAELIANRCPEFDYNWA